MRAATGELGGCCQWVVPSGGELQDVVQEGVDAVGEAEAGAAGGGGDPGGVGVLTVGVFGVGVFGVGWVVSEGAFGVGLGCGRVAEGDVFEHGGPACLDGPAGVVEDLEAGLVGGGACWVRGQVQAAFVDHHVVAAAQQGECVDVGGRSEERRVGKEST